MAVDDADAGLEMTGTPASGYGLAAICDMNGIFRGKRVPAGKLEKLGETGIRMPLSSIGVDVWGVDVEGTRLTLEQGDLDGICEITGRRPLDLGYAGEGGALLPMWMRKEGGEPYFADGRRLLSDILARFAAKGLTPVAATEVEFYLLDPSNPDPSPAPGGTGSPPGGFDNIYSLAELSAFAPFLDEVCSLAEKNGISVDAGIAEGGPRQFEFNLYHQPDALRIADDTVYFKQILRNVAVRHGYECTFMAKPYQGHAGNGLHVHFSVLDSDGRNIFDDGGERGSDQLRHAVGGLLASMREMTLVFAPHLNSFRRLAPGGLAPTTATWGYENRTAALRIPAGPTVARRIEHRVAGADANPYLVLSAIFSAVLDGIENRIAPPEPHVGNSHRSTAETLARDWREALEIFAASDRNRRLLHPEFTAAFAACKTQEQEGFAARMTEFEISTYRLSV